jgi:site-specific DNA recombinase
MEVALYVRVSTTRQQHTQTIAQQLERLRAHVVAQPDWHLAEEHIYCDDGYSGAKLNRPGLDRLRDRAAMAAFERVLITAPDRLARNYVHQMLLIDELLQRGCQVEFLERPMSSDPHDQLLLQIRGAVAEYERSLIADRMRRGRHAKLRSGQLLPWTVAPYGYILDAEHPRDPSRLRIDPVKAAVVTQIFAWYSEPQTPVSLYSVAKRLSDAQVPTPTGKPRWNVASVRGILRSPAYAGTAYSGRTRPAPARHRKSALRPVGPGESQQPAPPEEWIAVPVPAIVSQDTFEAAQARLNRNIQLARRNNTTHDYLLRGLVSCGQCQLACTGRALHPGYDYYICRGRTDALRAAQGERCTARYAPAGALDALVWQDLCHVLREPALVTHELQRAQGGAWLPQALQARRRTLQQALAQLERQQARLLEVYLADIIGRDEFERKHKEVTYTQHGLTHQLRQLEAQAQQQVNVAALAQGIETFCRRLGPTLDALTFAQRRQLVELLIDRVIVTDGQVEIRYVVPTGPKGESTPFCHLRLDYLNLEP